MPQPEPVQVAFRVYATDWGMRGHGSRQIDWLVDGEFLHKDNVLFVIEQPITKSYEEALRNRYRVADVSRHLFNPWQTFLSQWQPHHYVTYNDFHLRHKVRNGLLRQAGCQTWHYSHSVNLPAEGYQPWKELEYDHLVLWNDTDAAQFDCTIPHQKHILGPLFSSQVPQAVVAIFDSTWEHYQLGAREKFFTNLYAVLRLNPGMIMLYKPKMKPLPMPDIKNFYVLPEWIEPGLVIGCADLTIGIIGASPVIEAEGAYRPSFWYDPLAQTAQDLHRAIENRLLDLPWHETNPAQRFRELLLK